MFLKSMALHNFRCFSDLEVNFNNRLTVIVGNNDAEVNSCRVRLELEQM